MHRLQTTVYEGIRADIRSTIRFLRETLSDLNTYIWRELANRGDIIRLGTSSGDSPMLQALHVIYLSKYTDSLI